MTAPLAEQVLTLALAIQQIPASTFFEEQRAIFVHNRFLAEGLSDVRIDAAGNVYARLPGAGEAHPLVVTAHLDTVFPLATSLEARHEPERITAPGIGDNSLGVAGLFGLVWALKASESLRQKDSLPLPGDVWLVANVGEEGLGNLRGMKAVVDHFGDQPVAYIILEGMSLGWVYHRGLGVQRYRITVRTPGGHSWIDFGCPSAVHELAVLVTSLNALVLPEQPRTTLNVGVIQGGTSVNTIAAEAHLELDLRSEEVEALAKLVNQVERLVVTANRTDVEVTAHIIGQRPAGEISPNHPLVRLAFSCLEAQGLQPRLNIGSTDANVPLSLGLPAICIGLTTGSGAHTTSEYILTQPVAQGLAQLVDVVTGAFHLPDAFSRG
jgi:acetylornithine deacetylase/succinyl-diaminopimelate desuccinylase-like protein